MGTNYRDGRNVWDSGYAKAQQELWAACAKDPYVTLEHAVRKATEIFGPERIQGRATVAVRYLGAYGWTHRDLCRAFS